MGCGCKKKAQTPTTTNTVQVTEGTSINLTPEQQAEINKLADKLNQASSQ